MSAKWLNDFIRDAKNTTKNINTIVETFNKLFYDSSQCCKKAYRQVTKHSKQQKWFDKTCIKLKTDKYFEILDKIGVM